MKHQLKNQIKIGTRGSKLALWQARWVQSALKQIDPELEVELLIIKTKGDKILDVPLAKVGGKGLFVKEIEEALLDGRIDLAVHSMKDMPAGIPPGLCIGAVPRRESPLDVLISNQGPLDALPDGARVGTSSLRRAAQLRHARGDLAIESLRGNLDTRLKKLETQGLDAIVLAAAGVHRMKLAHRITQYLDESVMLPAVGQGALCIETRENDPDVAARVKPLEHAATRKVVFAERAFLDRLEGGCQVPIAAHAKIENGMFTIDGLVAAVDGKIVHRDRQSGSPEMAETIGVQLAQRLLDRGAKAILSELKENSG